MMIKIFLQTKSQLLLFQLQTKGLDNSVGLKKPQSSSSPIEEVRFNNVVGTKNPPPGGLYSYFFTDKSHTRQMLNVYISGYTDKNEKAVVKKIKNSSQMIQTIELIPPST